jgi:general secretion pathway protein J
VGKNSLPYDSLDFAAFTHRRTTRDAHESDQAEIGYYVAPDPDNDEKNDLVRREQTPIDLEPTKGGVREVVAEDVVEFDVRYFDPLTGQWGDVWDTTQINGQPNRMPLEVSIKIVLKGVGNGDPYTYETKVFLPMQQPLSFGIPKQ